MENIKYNELSNAELRLRMETLTHDFENKKAELIKLCEEMDRVEKDYLRAKHELEIRKNIYM
jgi:hypothetical protein